MKICEIKYLLNNLPLLLENMSLGEVKRRIKNNTLKVDSGDKEWYNNENNREELIDTITYFNTTGHLKNFNTEPYLKNKKFLPAKLMNDLELKLAEIESKNLIESGKNNFDSVSIGNDITVYAPYTPETNAKLAYKGVVKGRDPYPTWCIASPTSGADMWDYYSIHESNYPAVFLVVKDGVTDNAILYNKDRKPFRGQAHNLRYELLGSVEDETIARFLDGDISLDNYIEEWRNATQEEVSFNDTTLFKNLGITEKELANAIRKLLIRGKANNFSERFGGRRLDSVRAILDSPDAPKQKRLGALLTLCNADLLMTDDWGASGDFLEKLKPDELLFVLRVCRRYVYYDKFISACKDIILSTGEPVIEYIIRQQESLSDLADIARPILRSASQYVGVLTNKAKALIDKNTGPDIDSKSPYFKQRRVIMNIYSLLASYRHNWDYSENKWRVYKCYQELLSLIPRHIIYSFDALKFHLIRGYYSDADSIYEGIIKHDNDVSLDDVYQTVHKIYTEISTNEAYKFYKLGDTMIYLLDRPDLAKKYLTEDDVLPMFDYSFSQDWEPADQQLIIGKLLPLLAHFSTLNKDLDIEEIIVTLIPDYQANVSKNLMPLLKMLEKNNLATPWIKNIITSWSYNKVPG